MVLGCVLCTDIQGHSGLACVFSLPPFFLCRTGRLGAFAYMTCTRKEFYFGCSVSTFAFFARVVFPSPLYAFGRGCRVGGVGWDVLRAFVYFAWC